MNSNDPQRRRARGARSVPLLPFVVGILLVVVSAAAPAIATVSAPGGASVASGSARSVSVGTDAGTVSINGSAPGVTVGRSGAAPTFTFTFTALTSATPGSYGYTFFDDAGGSSGFTLTVTAPATTTTQPPAPTTTQPPATTTTTRPTTTTTRPTTTTTRPTTTTTTTAATTTTTLGLVITTTRATTTTTPPTTTTTSTTVPPTTTTSTLVPAEIVALGSSGESNPPGPFVWFGGGAVLLALVLAGAYVMWSRQGPTYGAATPGFVLAWRRRRERKRLRRPSHMSPASGFSAWWRTSGPIISYHEWRDTRHASKTVRRQIEDRQRLRRRED